MRTQLGRMTMLLLITFSIALSQESPRPIAPYIYKKICPFEGGCDFTSIGTLQSIPAYAMAGDKLAKLFMVPIGDSLAFNFGSLFVERLGLAIVTHPWQEFLVGDTVIIMGYGGEGSFEIWHKGLAQYVECFWPSNSSMDLAADLIVSPQMTWWANVTDKKARTFWLRLINLTPAEGLDFGDLVEFYPIR